MYKSCSFSIQGLFNKKSHFQGVSRTEQFFLGYSRPVRTMNSVFSIHQCSPILHIESDNWRQKTEKNKLVWTLFGTKNLGDQCKWYGILMLLPSRFWHANPQKTEEEVFLKNRSIFASNSKSRFVSITKLTTKDCFCHSSLSPRKGCLESVLKNDLNLI